MRGSVIDSRKQPAAEWRTFLRRSGTLDRQRHTPPPPYHSCPSTPCATPWPVATPSIANSDVARPAAQLSHPNIVPVHHADAVGDLAFFAMGYVDGENLGDRVRARGALPVAEAVRYLREAAWALALSLIHI